MRRWSKCGWAALFLILCTYPLLGWTRLYDSDEFEHLHAAYCIAEGMVPYRDYFEHHGPLDYYLLAPFVKLLGPVPELLHVHRAISFVWILVATAAAVHLSTRLAGRSIAPWAGVWLVTFSWFAEKGIEGRPDVAAMALVAVAACVLQRAAGDRSPVWRSLVSGVLLGLATLFTLKSAFLGIGLAAGAAITRSTRGLRFKSALAFGAVGITLPWILSAATFARAGALNAFLDCVIVIPATWPAHELDPSESIVTRLISRTEWSPGHVGLGLFGLVATLWALAKSSADRRRGSAIPCIACVAHLLSLAVMPAAYLQFHLLALPLFAVLAARMMRSVNWRTVLMVVAMFVGTLFLSGRAPGIRPGSTDPYLVADGIAAAGLALCSVGFVGTLAMRWKAVRRLAAAAVLAAACLTGPGRIVIQHLYWNHGAAQREQVRSFDSYGGKVLDGFSGIACLKPHAFYWWWINQHSIPLIRRRGDYPALLETVRQAVPTVVIYDEHMARAGAELRALLESRYRLVRMRPPAMFVRPDIPRQGP